MKRYFCVCLLFVCAGLAMAGNIPISLDSILSGAFKPSVLPERCPLADPLSFASLSLDGKKIVRYDYKTGSQQETVLDLEKARGVSLKKVEGYAFNAQENRILLWTERRPLFRRSWVTDYYLFDRKRNLIEPLSDKKNQRNATFSPDGRSVAFSSENNLYIKRLDYGTELAVTTDGQANALINGTTDWVYEEEFATTHAYDWSADGQYLAYLKFDERAVTDYTFAVYGAFRAGKTQPSYFPTFKTFKYPSAGGANATVSLYVYQLQSRSNKRLTVPVDEDGYLPRIRFTKKANQLAVMTLNRSQTAFNLYFLNIRSGMSNLVISERNESYVEPEYDAIQFYSTFFTYLSDKDGFSHLYLYDANGHLIKQLSSGKWDVTQYIGCDTLKNRFYYQAAVASPMVRSLWGVDLKGKTTPIGVESGVNAASFNADYSLCVLTHSDLNTPPQTRIVDLAGKQLRVLSDNSALVKKLAEVELPKKSFFTLQTQDGQVLNGWMLKPYSFKSTERYPAIVLQYSGPDAQKVLDQYSLDWDYYLASQGFVVVCVDGRGSGGRGASFRRQTVRKLGQFEVQDQLAVADYLKSLPYIDGKRLGIWGWSYGGFITLMTMTETNQPFKAGIAVAPVCDFRYYNTIYSERFLKTPAENQEGYDASSPLLRASQLSGRLLLIHGLADDNVRSNQSMDMAEAFIQAGKQFDVQFYPTSNHSIVGETYRRHLYRAKVDFFLKNLQ